MKEQIIKQAIEDFMLYGFKSFTMDDLAHKVGISKRTLYEVFPSKTELIEACVESVLKHIKEEGKCLIEGEGNVIENWIATEGKFAERFKISSNRPLWELKKYYREIYEKMDKQFRELDDREIEILVKKGQEEGFFRENIDLNFTKAFLYGMNKMRESPHIFPETKFMFWEIASKQIESFIRILVNEKGLQELERVLKEKRGY